MRWRGIFAWLVVLVPVGADLTGCVNSGASALRTGRSAPAAEQSVVVIQAYAAGLAQVHAANPDVKLSLGRDPDAHNEPVLLVTYPVPTPDAAGRDVLCDAQSRDWSAGHAIAFRIKPDHAVKLSVSLLDRNRVAYTTWTELQGGVWQPVRIAFDDLRPNPYFQPPDAKNGAPIDVSQVNGIIFAPHDDTPGRLALSKFVVLE